MEEKKNITKHHGSGKRPHRLEVIFADDEWDTIVANTAKAGEKSVSKYVRKLVVNGGKVVAPLSNEEKKNIEQLHKIGVNIWQVRTALKNYGVNEEVLKELSDFKVNFAEILKHYRKISRKK